MAPKTSSIHTISDIRCAIFDLDGTLIDSVPVYLQLMETIFKAIGLPPAPKQLVSEFMNGGGLKVIEKHIPPELQHHKDDILKQFKIAGRNTSQYAFKSRIKVFDGVQPLFLRLSALTIPIGIVTSTERAHIGRKLRLLERAGLTQYLDEVIVIEDAPRKKPAPDPLLVCSERLGVNVENCIYVGDSHVDIRAANGAGMMAIGVLSGLDDHETLMAEKPQMILENVNELVKVF